MCIILHVWDFHLSIRGLTLKRILLYILLLALLLALLSACSSGSSESDEDGSYGSASGAGDTGGPGSDESEYEAALSSGDLVERYDPERDGYYIEEEQSPEDAEEASALAEENQEYSNVDGYVPEGEALAGEPYSNIEGLSEIPRNDRRFVCGYSTNVFVADVLEPYSEVSLDPDAVEGETTPPSIPQSQFLVVPVSGYPEAKGTLDPATRVLADDATTLAYIVNQIGGDNGNGLQLIEGDPLLIPGQRYVFATTYDDVTGWYSLIVQPEGDVRVSSDQERDKQVRTMNKGCKYEKTPEDVQSSLENGEQLTSDEQYIEEEPSYVLRTDGPDQEPDREEE